MLKLLRSFMGFKGFHSLRNVLSRFVRKLKILALTFLFTISAMQSAWAGTGPEQSPLFLTNPIVPIMMLNISKDHQLYFKAYDDYSDITDSNPLDSAGNPNLNYGGSPDGRADTTYVTTYKYFGYFDSYKCYTYSTSNQRFEPSSMATLTRHYCNNSATNEWSGNFLNWASMTRMDVVRKILYGGLRSTDNSTDTVLERAFITADAHAFAKYYDGNDISKLTPFNTVPVLQSGTAATGITLCNVTVDSSSYSQSVNKDPLIRVAKGNYKFWASNERWQCRWASEKNQTLSAASGSNGNNQTLTGDFAYNDNPVAANQLFEGTARILACVSPFSPDESPAGSYGECNKYPSGNYKPVGLLQQYGEPTGSSNVSKINFGLITGSYKKNKSGGVLRKNIGNMADEINYTSDGRFKSVPSAGSVIGTLNALRIYGYNYSSGIYNDSGSGDNCSWGIIGTFTQGNCSNWGNPQSEIYLESLRYLLNGGVNKSVTSPTPTASYSADDSGYLSKLKTATWTAPLTNANYCAPLNILQFNGSSSSYDTDSGSSYNSSTDIGLSGGGTDVKSWTDQVGKYDGLDNKSWFFGVLLPSSYDPKVAVADGLCTAKPLDALSNVSGTCNDAPRLEGSYNMAGLAYYARSTGFSPYGLIDGKKNAVTKQIRTYGVALAPSTPKVEIPVPSGAKVIIQPACQNLSVEGNCAIVDFKVLSQQSNVTLSNTGDPAIDGLIGNQGKLYVNWEDSEQGGDYDQDMWGVIDYAVTSANVVVKTTVVAQSTPNQMGFGYVITGTGKTTDGFQVHTGINNFIDAKSCTGKTGYSCTCLTSGTFGSCNSAEASHSRTYPIVSSASQNLEPPLYYASKWGGYSDEFAAKSTSLVTDIAARNPTGDSYYFASNPSELKQNLLNAFDDISKRTGSAAAVATNSTHLSETTYVYQAQFNSTTWNGTLNAYKFDNSGNLATTPSYSTETTMPKSGTGRTIYTYNGSSLVPLAWGNLTPTQQNALYKGAESSPTNAQKRLDWLLGNPTNETVAGGLRDRGTDGTNVARNILGDVVNSSPAYFGAKNHWYDGLPGSAGSSYRAYVETKKARLTSTSTPPMLFVGSNDGMVHAFNADNLKELWAYVPNLSFPKLANLTAPDYGKTTNPHTYIMDGPITVGDVYFSNGSGGGDWRTVIVGTMGAGGKGVYGLDVTDPVPKVLFEIDPSNSQFASLGYVMGKPVIAPLTNGRWGAIFGNGDTNPITKTSRLFVIDIEDPYSSNSKIIDTGAGTGLSAVAVLPDSYGRAQKAYAGDINGNMWRFDLTSFTKDLKVFSATDASNNIQPITAAPTLGINYAKGGNLMVYFGTGKYYDLADGQLGTTTHSFYAIADIGATVTRGTLKSKTYSSDYSVDPHTRTVVESNPTWSTQNGWYMDLSETVGERVTTQALLVTDKLIFPTLTPSTIPCEFGGTSWLMELVAVGDKYQGEHVLDDPLFNKFLVLGDLGIGLVAGDPNKTPLPGETEPPCGEGRILSSLSDATVLSTKANMQCKFIGRQSWRQVR